MRFLVVLFLLALPGCGLVYDFDPADDAGGPGRIDAARPNDAGVRPVDASIPFDASGCAQGDGEQCSPDDAPYRICLAGLCVPSVCGDLFIDVHLGETCELNDASCVDCGLTACACPEIQLPCREPACSGAECLFVQLPDGTTCLAANDVSGECEGGTCRLRSCGDGNLDIGEQCDDGDDLANDGCENDCTFTCATNVDCDDFDACNGVETCSVSPDPATRTCVPSLGMPDLALCEVCDADIGIHLPDVDGDGFARDMGQPCPQFDCDDDDPLVHPGAAEVCDGVDNDCNASTPDSITLTCGIDEDDDGWPRTGEMIPVGCGAMCPSDMAPTRSIDGTPVFDCDDDDPDVHPTQTMFFDDPRTCAVGSAGCAHPYDYNCDGAGEQEDLRVEHCALLDLPCSGGNGWVGAPPACGEDGRFATCRVALICVPFPMNRKQGCR